MNIYIQKIWFWFREAKLRWSADAGSFWTGWLWLAGFFTTIGTALSVTVHLSNIGNYILEAGIIMGLVAKFGAKHPPLVKPNETVNKQ